MGFVFFRSCKEVRMGRFWRVCWTWIILSITIFISDNKFNFLATNYGRGYNELRPLFFLASQMTEI